METIYITSWNGDGQYDDNGRQIVEWNEKACNWFVLPEFEDCELIYKEDKNGISYIPRAAYKKDYPDIDKYPDIILMIQYDYQGKTYYNNRYWGYLEYNKDEAIEKLGKNYLNSICENFSNIKLELYYNDEFIWSNINSK